MTEFKLRNCTDIPIALSLEPWGEEICIQPSKVITIRQFADENGRAELECNKDYMVFYGNVEFKVKIECEGTTIWESYGDDYDGARQIY
jgi:hypothetical protein